MAQQLELFELIFHQTSQDNYYMAGNTIRGVIVLVAPNPLKIRQMTVEFKGEARNGWVNKTSDKIYESAEVYLTESVEPLRPGQTLSSGKHTIPFQHVLPEHLPSSFDGEFGHIRYVARAALATTDTGQEVASERLFNVIARLNLLQFPVTRHPVEALDETEFRCCCIPLGSVHATITIPKNGYLPNESMLINAEIYNGSRKKIEDSQIALIQNAKFSAWSRYENAEDTKEMQYIVASVSKGNIQPRRTLRIQSQELQVPSVIPTYQGNIIKITYILRFEATPGIEIEIPITIGTTNVPSR